MYCSVVYHCIIYIFLLELSKTSRPESSCAAWAEGLARHFLVVSPGANASAPCLDGVPASSTRTVEAGILSSCVACVAGGWRALIERRARYEQKKGRTVVLQSPRASHQAMFQSISQIEILQTKTSIVNEM